MKQPLQRLTVTLALATAAFTGYTVIDGLTSTPPDTGWGAPATTHDTGWGTPSTDNAGGPSVTPYDTGWGLTAAPPRAGPAGVPPAPCRATLMPGGNTRPETRHRGGMPPAEDPTLSDLRRELAKAREALAGAEQHLARHAEMNAALHCATNVMYSPLHAKVTTAIAGIDHALQRSQPAVTATAMAPAPQHTDANCPWVALLAELDRCEHTRHQGDVCGSCDGTSRGNPHMQPGDVIGYSLRHGEIVMPDRENKHDISAWRHTPAEDGS